MVFPPVPIFPKGIDNNYTLFLVHNTTETKICTENSAWADEIEIIPVKPDRPEIWADNGFGNISGELFYYDYVEKNEHGKVVKLKRCARNLGGTHTRYNPPGTWVRSFVVAETHNQLVNAILNIQDFVGFNFDPRQETLDWRIRNLEALQVIFDDFACPDVVFTFNIIENDPVTGILAEYLVEITPAGSTSNANFRLDFGDGEFTTTDLQGSHRYPVNATIDPVVTVSNNKCQIIQTPVERDNPSQPPEIIEQVFTIPNPEIPTVPDFNFVPCDVPEPDINLPPFVFPCGISLDGQNPFSIVIDGGPIQMVSHVLIEATNDVQILHSVVTIQGDVNIPSIIFVDLPTIVIDPPIPPTIVIVADSNISLGLNTMNVPSLNVNWGDMPKVQLTTTRRVKQTNVNEGAIEEFGEEFADLFSAQSHTKVEYEEVGIPEEIRIIAPTMPKIKFDTRNFPRTIKVDTSEANIPTDIKIHGPDSPIPSRIVIDGPKDPLPNFIEVVNKDVPNNIEVTMKTAIPEIITVEMARDIPNRIVVETLTPIPEHILVKGIPDELRVVGIPDHIEVTGFPDSIPVTFPDEMPQIELVYKGAPIEFKVNLQPIVDSETGDPKQCFMLVPCGT